ncbi:kinase-like protein [Lentinula raphanica]|uniref:Kinase-like protein n=1 Tax=Lentinula raphanica TaxID=153919 RepID=A0AA38PAH0_9AGAR|nr:kinase-like protein [Lentinula raphanica]KAJ3839332.1 kinase-like protein [Lentinula raphanica]
MSTHANGSETSADGTNTQSEAPGADKVNDGQPSLKWVRGELIGRSGRISVYLALNTNTSEFIIAKQVEIAQNTVSSSALQLLKRESETLKDLEHPNIIQYLGFEITPTMSSLFLEYVSGGTIGDLILKSNTFSENVIKSFTAQVLRGVEYLHSQAILHRDITADHVHVDSKGVCKISDFGNSKHIAPSLGHNTSADTIEKVYNTTAIDIWSVGCLALQMWAGERLWNVDETGLFGVMFKLWASKAPPPLPERCMLSGPAEDFRKKCFIINLDESPSATVLLTHEYLELPVDWEFNGVTV